MKRATAAVKFFLLPIMLVFASVLLVPPVRDNFFYTNLWPFPLKSELTAEQVRQVKELARPGDVLVEANMHYWQWVLLSAAGTGSTWVHTALVDDKGGLLSMNKEIKEMPITIYLDWHSTQLALVRPPYKNPESTARAIAYARSQIGIPFDPQFRIPSASCTGLVGESLKRADVPVPATERFGHTYYGAASFFQIPGAKVIWRSDPH